MKRLTIVIASVAALGLTLAGCGGTANPGNSDSPGSAGSPGSSSPASQPALTTIKPGSLTVCSDVPFPPFEVEDKNSPIGYSGFDIDLISAIADKLSLKVVIAVTDFNALQSGAALAAGSCDIAVSAVTITEKRKANIDFSDPYYDSLQSLLVPPGSPIKSLADTVGKKIGVQTGTTGEAYANEHKPAGATLVSFPTDGEEWAALQAGTVDALLQDHPVNSQHVKTDPTYVIVEKYDTKEQYGFAFLKDENPQLREAVNAQLKALRDDGTYDTIYKKYFA